MGNFSIHQHNLKGGLARTATGVDHVAEATFRRLPKGTLVGEVFLDFGVELEVRSTPDGWLVTDENDNHFEKPTMGEALTQAIAYNLP